MALYLLFLMLPIYWLINMSLKTNAGDPVGLDALSRRADLANYITIFTDPAWYMGYVNSLIYVTLNTVISLDGGALPAAYAFQPLHFLGDKHLFFWLLTNRMAPPRFSRCPSSSSTRRSGCSTRTSPWRWRIRCSTCRWRCGSLKASCAACPRRSMRPPISTAIRSRVLREDLHAADRLGHRRRGVLLLHVLWVELLLSRTLTATDAKPIAAIMTRTVGPRASTGVCLARPGC
jgi:glycerol transport system permease protein